MAALSLSICLFLLGFLAANVDAPSRLARLLAALAACLVILLSAAFLVSDYFTGNGITETVAFHLESGFRGAGISEHIGLGLAVIFGVTVASLPLAILFRVMPRYNLRHRVNVVRALSAALIVASLAVHPAVKDAWRLAPLYWPDTHTDPADAVAYPAEYVIPEPGAHRDRNLVFLYLEGLEQTYFNEELFPGLLPNLSRIRDNAVIYSDISHTVGSQWTIAGMVSSQCGLPLLASSGTNAMEGVDRFLPEAVCLGDILKEAGYRLAYMGGADLAFAGKGNFYRSHGFDDVLGRTELENEVSAGYLSSWGLYDDSLFTELKRKFDAFSSDHRPFGLFGLTLDTHHPTGHPSGSCEQNPYQDGDSSMLNAVHCTDRLAAEFINYIRQSEYGDETVIVVASDHLALRSDITHRLEKADRRHLLMILSPGGESFKIDRPGTTLDVAATVLDWLGFEVDGLGFGRNLNGDGQSLRTAETDLGEFLLGHRDFLNTLWRYPQLANGVKLADEGPDGMLTLGHRRIAAPAIFKVGDNGEVDDVILSTERDRNLTDIMRNLADNQRFLWVDRCAYIREFIGKIDREAAIRDRWCAVAGSLSGPELAYAMFADDTALGLSDLSHGLTRQPGDHSLAETRRKRLHLIHEMGGNPQLVAVDSESLAGIQIKSAGFGFGQSFVQTEEARLTLQRGLTLVGIGPEGDIEVYHEDTCDSSQDRDQDRIIADFNAGLDKLKARDAMPFALIAHDSAVCGTEELVGRLRTAWGGTTEGMIGFREPYVGIIRDESIAEEFNAAPGMTIGIELDSAPQRP